MFSADGTRLLSSSIDNTIRIWDVATGKELHRFSGFSEVGCVAFVDGDRRVLCARDGDDPRLELWDVEQNKKVQVSPVVPQGFHGLASLPGGGRAVTAGRDGMIRLWQWKI